MNIARIRNATLDAAVLLSTTCAGAKTPKEIVTALKRAENSTGNIADAVEEATGARGCRSSDMKPIYDVKIVGRAATALMRPVLRTEIRKYRNHLLEILAFDIAELRRMVFPAWSRRVSRPPRLDAW